MPEKKQSGKVPNKTLFIDPEKTLGEWPTKYSFIHSFNLLSSFVLVKDLMNENNECILKCWLGPVYKQVR